MSEPKLNYVSCPDSNGSHRMAYWQWGDPSARHLVVCVHGLSRQGRDFDVLARELVRRGGGALQVVCPDVVGRGKSDWLRDPTGYQIPAYVVDMLALLHHLHQASAIETLDCVGTSMGGLIGLGLCGHPDLPLPVPVRRLVLNDVGPVIQWASLLRIGQYLGDIARYQTLEQAADAMWAVSTSFGPLTKEQWLTLSKAMVRSHPDGGLTQHYDPAIAVPFQSLTEESVVAGEQAVWQLYDGVTARTLLLRGIESDLLSAETARQMMLRGPKAQLLEFAGVGHAPMLVAQDQVDAVADFLLVP